MANELTKAEQFFYDNAGWSYDPKVETSDEGKVKCAKVMAQAEIWARENCYSFQWDYERENPSDVFGKACPKREKCIDDKCPYAHYNPKNDFFCATIWDNSDTPEVVGSLGMIAAPSPEYRRVVEAELAMEAQAREEAQPKGE